MSVATVDIELGQDSLDALDWLAGHQDSSREHIVRALLMNGLQLASESLSGDDDFSLMVDAARLEFKRWCRAEAPEIWRRTRSRT